MLTYTAQHANHKQIGENNSNKTKIEILFFFSSIIVGTGPSFVVGHVILLYCKCTQEVFR